MCCSPPGFLILPPFGPSARYRKAVRFHGGDKRKILFGPELVAAGVRGINLAMSLYRAAMTGLVEAAREVRDSREFGFLDRSITTPELIDLMRM